MARDPSRRVRVSSTAWSAVASTALAAILGLALCAAPALAEVQFTSVSRSLDADAYESLDASYYINYYDEHDYDSFSGPGVWNSSVEANAYPFDGAPLGRGTMSLDSFVGPNRIGFASSGEASGGDYNVSGGDPLDPASYYYVDEYTEGYASADLNALFTLDASTPFSLMLDGLDGYPNATVSVDLSAQLFWTPVGSPRRSLFDYDFADAEAGLMQAGILEPGTYELVIHHGVDHYDSTPTEFGFLLVIPEPGTGLLMGIGIAGLTARRRGRRVA